MYLVAALLGGDTQEDRGAPTQTQIYYHYGYRYEAPSFAENGMCPWSFGTPDREIFPGTVAQQRYGLPPKDAVDSPPDARYRIVVPPGYPVIPLGEVAGVTFLPGPDNPTGQPVTRTGGGKQVRFPRGTPPGSVSPPQSVPPC